MSVLASAADVSAIDWGVAVAALDRDGYAIVPKLLGPDACAAISGLYDAPDRFRSRIVMARHGFGQGEYQYFSYPLPPIIDALRHQAYGPLAVLANRWRERLGQPAPYPATLEAFLKACHEVGQPRPTPLLLRYGPGDFNRLHQDLYGYVFFDIQLAVLLNQPGRDFEGGELVLTEARPRMQSRAIVVPLDQGDGVVFAVNQRPVQGTRGYYRAQMRHGVSTIRGGQRHTLGVIFHDGR